VGCPVQHPDLLEQGHVVNGVLNVIVSLLLGFLAVWAGIDGGRAIWHYAR